MEALTDLVRAGKVRYIGCSNLFGWQIVKHNLTSSRAGGARFVSAQHLYNLIRREIEREVLPACEDQGVGMICWSPLASGMLTGKYRGEKQPTSEGRMSKAQYVVRRFWNDASVALVEEVARVGEEIGASPSQVSLAWLLGDRRVTAPIVGARTVDQIAENLGAGDLDLPQELRDRLSDALPLDHGYPNDWMRGSMPAMLKHAEFEPPHASRVP